MILKVKITPVFFLFVAACGDSTVFKEIEVGQIKVTVAGENDPSAPSIDGSVPLERVLDTLTSQTISEEGTETESTNSSKVEAGLAETDSSSKHSGSGSEGGNNQKGELASADQDNLSVGSDSTAKTLDEQTMKLCSELFKGKAKYIKMIHSPDSVATLQANSKTVIAVRLSGNQAKFDLNVGGSQKLAGLCILATGNMPSTKISSSVDMGQIVYVGRGNQSRASFAFNASKLDSAYVNLKGNSHKVNFEGVGAAVCSTLELSQGKSTVTCK